MTTPDEHFPAPDDDPSVVEVAGSADQSGVTRSPGRRWVEIPINVWGFFLLVAYLDHFGATLDAVALLICLGCFCIWTEAALVERRVGALAALLSRKHLEDSLASFIGALTGLGVIGSAGIHSGLARSIAVPGGMALGAFLTVVVPTLDWRRGILATLMVVESGAYGRILRTAVTVSVWLLVLRRQ